VAHKIVFTEDALVDLEIILEFIRADNSDAAERFGAALLDHIEILANFPRLGGSLDRRPGIRKILHSPIRVYYQVDEDAGLIEILHLWHAARREPPWGEVSQGGD
jgi:toxin ParE1/3/4